MVRTPEGCVSGMRLARMACSRVASHTGVPQGWPSVARPAMDGHVLAGKVLPVLKLGMNTGLMECQQEKERIRSPYSKCKVIISISNIISSQPGSVGTWNQRSNHGQASRPCCPGQEIKHAIRCGGPWLVLLTTKQAPLVGLRPRRLPCRFGAWAYPCPQHSPVPQLSPNRLLQINSRYSRFIKF